MINFNQITFLTSCTSVILAPQDEIKEIAFVGRSNAGKSSALNVLANAKVARTSKTPGRTQLINFFTLPPSYRFVDLPGYGYAKVPISVKEHWQNYLAEYLELRKNLIAIVLLMDIRHTLTEFDISMLRFASYNNKPVHILLSKADKISFGAGKNILNEVTNKIKHENQRLVFNVQIFSSLKKQGLTECKDAISKLFNDHM